ncbi:thymidylate synthase [Candidatus Campbellbacteria bacterium]|nr:MAG: thymidylate synthase [Candidatus Campbellbacteria bacterium]
MKQYLEALNHVFQNGDEREGRNGVTKFCTCVQMRFNLKEGFPAVTTKKLPFKSVLSELLWFLEGTGDERRLCEILHGIRDESKKTIWTANALAPYWEKRGLKKHKYDLGRVYGVQWRHWKKSDGSELDQISDLVEKIRTDPFNRRLIVTAWNPAELDQMALPPCHRDFQVFVDSKGGMSLHMNQRSCDMFLGVPFNIASYALLLHMIASVTGYEAKELILTLNDAHIYKAHYEVVQKQLQRTPHKLPKLWINPNINSIDSFSMGDFKLLNYENDQSLKAPMVV